MYKNTKVTIATDLRHTDYCLNKDNRIALNSTN